MTTPSTRRRPKPSKQEQWRALAVESLNIAIDELGIDGVLRIVADRAASTTASWQLLHPSALSA